MKYKYIIIIWFLFALAACKVETTITHGNTVIRGKNPVNKKVGEFFGELARARAEEFLCVDPDSYNIIIIDTKKHKIKVKRYDTAVVLPWIFDKNEFIDRQKTSLDKKVEFYTSYLTTNSAISHELGHYIWGKYIIADKVLEEKHKYGTFAPDWMDEAAAILFEQDESKMLRTVQFYDSMRKGYTFNAEKLLKQIHPIWLRNKKQNSKQNYMDVTAPINGQEMMYNEALLFYLQSYMLAEYLIEKTGDQCIMAEIGKDIAKNNSFEQWLAEQVYIDNVNSVEQLNDDFNKWVEKEAELYPSLEEWLEEKFMPSNNKK